jgi:prephenate dehydrogenase
VSDVVDAAPELSSVLVVGAGLMGTSVALALRQQGRSVWLHDQDAQAVALGIALGAGQSLGAMADDPDLVVVAVPPQHVPPVIADMAESYVNATFTDLSSIKSLVQVEVEALLPDFDRFVGGHPMAGRERSGGGAARADLFDGRPWVVCPPPQARPGAEERVRRLAQLCGATPVTLPAARHDRAVALVSHVPQVAASLVAGRLADADADLLALAGQGVTDVTRIAASDPGLWTAILEGNASAVLEVLDGLADDLESVRRSLVESLSTSSDLSTNRDTDSALRRVLERGNRGRARLPGKHGGAPSTFVLVPVVIEDRPGELARLLVACGEAGVNVEDVSIEHSPGQPVGLVELSVRPDAAPHLGTALAAGGWSVH